ncbi:hypothetical protein HID58_046378 [Brassica napus]|uniref:OCRE domain-containing protein n=1 Tax=Brassica napus TaxID=3708 RepID=A0ABQ8AW88_BRANA|nr:hypothetical protein HID58_046378 [Brassica napus]
MEDDDISKMHHEFERTKQMPKMNPQENYFGCRKRKYGKPHQEFVNILCTYKDIFELRKRVEAFDLQYEMHASSYQRDCLRSNVDTVVTDWMLDSASGYFYNQTNGLHYEVLDSITVTQ